MHDITCKQLDYFSLSRKTSIWACYIFAGQTLVSILQVPTGKVFLDKQTSLKDKWGIRENRHVTATGIHWTKFEAGRAEARTDIHTHTHTHTHTSDEDKCTADCRNHMESVDHVCSNIIKNCNFKGTSLMGSHKDVTILRYVSKYLP
jgi:hypothetical protein